LNLGSSGNELVKIEPELNVKRGLSGLLFEVHGHGVDAPALIGGNVIALARKYVAQVGVTISAADFGANTWSQRAVFNQLHSIICSWRIERWPATTRVKLCLGFKEFVTASLASIASDFIGVVIFASKWTFGRTFAQNCI